MYKKISKKLDLILIFIIILLCFIYEGNKIAYSIWSFGKWFEYTWRFVLIYIYIRQGIYFFVKNKIKAIFKLTNVIFTLLMIPSILTIIMEKELSLINFYSEETFIMDAIFVIVFVTIKIIEVNHVKNRNICEKVDYKNVPYFREKILEFSPAILSYLCDLKIDKKDIVATLMGLEIKGKIKIGERIVVSDDTDEKLTSTEKYLLNLLINKNILKINLEEFENIVRNECVANGLLREKFYVLKGENFVIAFIAVLIIILSSVIVGMFIPVIEEIALWIAGGSIIVLTIIAPIVMYIGGFLWALVSDLPKYHYTIQGKTIFTNLIGLKKYIQDYSAMKDRKKEDLILWEEYLIYSVMFGENNKIVEDIFKLLDN